MTQSAQTRVHPSPISRQRVAELRVQCQRDPHSVAVHRETVDEFLAAGLTAEALPLLRRLATLCPDDPAVLVLLARVCGERGDHREAIARHQQVAQMRPDSVDAWHDLGVAACTAGEYATARDAFERKVSLAPDSYETFNDLAVLYGMDRRGDDAAAAYRRCLTINPAYEKGRQNALHFFWDTGRYAEGLALVNDLIKTLGEDGVLATWRERLGNPAAAPAAATTEPRRTVVTARSDAPLVTNRKLAFVASADTFLRPIVSHFAAHNDVRCIFPQSSAEIAEIMRWADLTWFEWCDALVVQGSQLRKTGKIVCRLHSYEAFTDFPAQVNWRNIDRLILVNRSVEEILAQSGDLPTARTVIPNGVDPERFPLAKRERRGKKIASVGYINYKKNPSLLLQTFKVLHDWDPEFELHIAGAHQDPRIKVYFDHLLPRLNLPVTFHGWVEDMPAFYAEMDYVISTSLFESFHYSIAEGMLSGCLPLIHSWKGADYLYPGHALFDTPDAARAVVERYRDGDVERFMREHRQHIIDRFNWPDRLRDIDRMLHEVLMGEKVTPRDTKIDRIAAGRAKPAGEDFGCVSVIIPVVADESSLGKSVEAALAQTYCNVEVVVGIAAGSHAVADRLAAFGDQVTVVHADGTGIAAAINAAVQASQGDFVALCRPGDVFETDRIDRQVRRLAAADRLGLLCGTVSDGQVARMGSVDLPLSQVMMRRSVFDEVGWFEEHAPEDGDTDRGLASMWRRVAARYDVEVLGDLLAATTQGADTEILDRWNVCVKSPELTCPDQRSGDNAAGDMKVVFVGAADPGGQMAMWANALNRHAGLNARVLTHRQDACHPSDLVMRQVGSGKRDGRGRPSLPEILAEAERVIRDADLIVFGAGLAPGCDVPEHRLTDTDEQPFGTIHWPDYLEGKQCAAILFGTPSVRRNLNWYHEHLRTKGWPILTNDPVVHRWLPDCRWLAPLWSPGDMRAAERAAPTGSLSIITGLEPSAPAGGRLIDAALTEFVCRHPDATFTRTPAPTHSEVASQHPPAHVGIDRIAVGDGTFSLDSLENSALGRVNIVYCSPYTRALIAATTGTERVPWEMPATGRALTAVLDRCLQQPEERDARMAETQNWFATYWQELKLAPQIAGLLRRM
ncbi:MAG TPA: glycosyltransferase [Acidobacteriota bacterium]|nr:glycosyltransferase [Acidobacteriota bacterium]